MANSSTYGGSNDYDYQYRASLSTFRSYSRSNYRQSQGRKSIGAVLLFYLSLEEEYIWGKNKTHTNYCDDKQYLSEVHRKYYYDKSVHHQIEELMMILGDNSVELADLNSNHSRGSAQRVCLKYGSKAYYNFCEFIDQQMREDHSFILKYLTIEIPSQSSGEQALQNVFAWLRLPPSFQKILGIESVPVQDNILLLLDEVDLYMHPEWQRQFLFMLSERLKLEYPDKHIQVIISTHSPLILSDIPSGNVIYLQKDKETGAFGQKPSSRESFGANLFSLLKDSFFLEKSLGEFAYRRISQIAKDLDNLKKSPDNAELRKQCQAHRQIIDIIGEPMLRGKLLSMYNEVLGEDARTLELEQLSRLLNTLKESNTPEDRQLYRNLLAKMYPEKD